ncbi:MAG: nicotinate-nucleotide diphosphorylase, partial [Legionella sp. 21-45-4]
MDLMHQHDIDDAVTAALKEDIGSGDITALLLLKTQWVEGTIISREPMVMCGQAWANQAFRAVDTSTKVEWLVPEGAFLEQPTILATITGPARGVLTAERTALNFLQTLSATASLTREYVLALAGTGVKLLDTRKTIPGLRLAQKYAVRAGGGQ